MKQEEAYAKLVSALKECDAHLQKITRGRDFLRQRFPLTEASFAAFDEESVGKLDQLLYRFTKMQDAMGLRLLPALYRIVSQEGEARPFLDILNALEKWGILSSVADWQYFRNLRNNLAHDYPESLSQTVSTLNAFFEEWPRMEELYRKVRAAAVERLNAAGILPLEG